MFDYAVSLVKCDSPEGDRCLLRQYYSLRVPISHFSTRELRRIEYLIHGPNLHTSR